MIPYTYIKYADFEQLVQQTIGMHQYELQKATLPFVCILQRTRFLQMLRFNGNAALCAVTVKKARGLSDAHFQRFLQYMERQ